jgi:diguanylate cyclase (GGDEF)-like protein/PAS domain S-box-containing protein
MELYPNGGDRMFFEQIVSKTNDIVIIAEIDEADRRFRIAYVNESFSRVFGYSTDEVMGRSPRILHGLATDSAIVDEIEAAIRKGQAIRRRLLNYAKGGRPVWIDANVIPLRTGDRVTHFASIERDITNDVRHEGALEDWALTDHLTKAGNRRHFDRILEREMSRARRFALPLSVAILDLDHFKFINDTWGSQAGDRVLIAFTSLVQKTIRNYDYVSRMGGAEFAVILPGAAGAEAVAIVERLCAEVRLSAIAATPDRMIHVTCSAGLATLAESDDSKESLVMRADRALYMAKNAGRDRVCEISA